MRTAWLALVLIACKIPALDAPIIGPADLACGKSSDCPGGRSCVFGTCCVEACRADASATCGHNGLCLTDGTGCAFYDATTTCGAPSCANGLLSVGGTCNGHGGCAIGQPSLCQSGLGCQDDTTCNITCTSDPQCTADASCTCTCAGPTDCPSNTACPSGGGKCSASCSGGLICNGGCCDGTSCQPGTDDHACGSGSCVDCGTGHCVAGFCTCQTNGDCPTNYDCIGTSCYPSTDACDGSGNCQVSCDETLRCLTGVCDNGACVASCAPGLMPDNNNVCGGICNPSDPVPCPNSARCDHDVCIDPTGCPSGERLNTELVCGGPCTTGNDCLSGFCSAASGGTCAAACDAADNNATCHGPCTGGNDCMSGYCDGSSCASSCSGGFAPDSANTCGGICSDGNVCQSGGLCECPSAAGGACLFASGSCYNESTCAHTTTGITPNIHGVCGGPCGQKVNANTYCDNSNDAWACCSSLSGFCIDPRTNASYSADNYGVDNYLICGGQCVDSTAGACTQGLCDGTSSRKCVDETYCSTYEGADPATYCGGGVSCDGSHPCKAGCCNSSSQCVGGEDDTVCGSNGTTCQNCTVGDPSGFCDTFSDGDELCHP